MLSPGRHHEKVPRSHLANLSWRKDAWARTKSDPGEQEAERDRCREDLLYYVNGWVWQYNPSKLGKEKGPFITWDFQDAALTYGTETTYGILQCIEEQKDLAIEKSREMGASWMFLIVADWLSLFHPNKKFLIVSRSADAVDCDSPDSLFWKLEFMHDHLPEFLRGKITRRKMYFGYPSGSSITGEASTGRAGVGGRATAMFVDEFAQIKEDREVYHRTSDTARCRIFNSTHLGLDTQFYQLTHPRSQIGSTRKLQLHWSQHPDKVAGLYRADNGRPEPLDLTYEYDRHFNFVLDGSPTGGPYPGLRSPWYDEQCLRKGSARAVAMDLDINPSGSVEQFFDPLEIRVLREMYCVEPYWVGELLWERETGKPLSLQRSAGGPLRLWCHLQKDLPPLGRYCIGGDVSSGTGTTNSVLTVCNAETGEKVAEYVNSRIAPDVFGGVAVALANLFTNGTSGALLCWEMAGPGGTMGTTVIELGYRNVYYRTDDFDLKKVRSDKPGWYPSPKAKRLLLEEYAAALRDRRFLNRCAESLDETLAFKYDATGNVVHSRELNDDPSGARVNHSDRVIADALAWKMCVVLGVTKARKQAERAPILSLGWRRELAEKKERELANWI
jgi:hypothetical protein